MPDMEAFSPGIEACNPDMEGLAADIEGFSGNLPLASLLQRFSPQLATQIVSQRGKRQSKDKLRALLLQICTDGFMTLQELEVLLDKHRNYLMFDYIRPLVRSGQLELRYPESAKYPHQAYVAAGAEDKNNGREESETGLASGEVRRRRPGIARTAAGAGMPDWSSLRASV